MADEQSWLSEATRLRRKRSKSASARLKLRIEEFGSRD
jgi:hypothetical protein